MELRLPQEKLVSLLHLIRTFEGKRKCTKKELLSLIGKLSFASKVIPSGRTFIRRLIDLSTTVNKLSHRISLNSAAREDLRWWSSVFAIMERQVQNFRALFDSEYTFKFVYGCLGERRLWYLFRRQMGGGSLARKVLTIFNPMERAISNLFGMRHLGSFISQEKIRISLR